VDNLVYSSRMSAKVRALALVSDLIFGTEPSWHDPATYSFVHGGKDGYPYPVDRDTYDQTIDDCGAAGCDRGCGDRGDGEVPGDTAVGGVCLIGRGCCFWCTWYVQRFNKLSINPSF